jgi:ribosomal protein L11 methyltransferase
VSEILGRACGGAVAIEAGYELVDDGLAARLDPSRPVTVRGYVAALDAGAARNSVERARRELGHLQAFGLRPIGELETRLVHEEDWADAWRSHFPVLRVGQRLVIRPTWREHSPAVDDVVLALDPGMAFGTGLHPTTRLCLAALEGLADAGHLRGARVLDVGSGSGILSVAAGLFGATSVVAVDTDPIAVEATRSNAQLNGMEDIVDARRGSISPTAGQFDVVLANLIASLLVDLAPALEQAVGLGGRLVASGIFIDREAEVVEAFGGVGLRVVGRSVETDWVALVAVAG